MLPISHSSQFASQFDQDTAIALHLSSLPEAAQASSSTQGQAEIEQAILAAALQNSQETACAEAAFAARTVENKQQFTQALQTFLNEKRKRMQDSMGIPGFPEGPISLIHSFVPSPDDSIQYEVRRITYDPTVFLAHEKSLARIISETGQLTMYCGHRDAWNKGLNDPVQKSHITACMSQLPQFSSFVLEHLQTSELFDELPRERFAEIIHLELPFDVICDARFRLKGKLDQKTVLETHIFESALKLTSLGIKVYCDLGTAFSKAGLLHKTREFKLPPTITRLELIACYGPPETINDDIVRWVKRCLTPEHLLVESSLQVTKQTRGYNAVMTLIPSSAQSVEQGTHVSLGSTGENTVA